MHNDTPRPVSIAILTTGLGVGGAERQLVRLATNIDRTKWEPTVISMLEPAEFGRTLDQAGIPVLTLSMTRGIPSPVAVLRLVRFLRELKPTILVCFMFHANLLGRVAGRLAGVPVIISSIRTPKIGSRWRELALRCTDWLGDVTTTNTQEVATTMCRLRVVPPDRIRVVPNAIATEACGVDPIVRDQTRAALGLHQGTFVWLAVGRLEAAKDYPNLLRSFAAHSAQSRLPSHLLVAGQGALLSELEDLACSLDIDGSVSFLGLRNDVTALLAAADAFVMSSAWEGSPNALLEAMAAGKPAVATSVGGVPELLSDGSLGFMVVPKNPEALAVAMTQLVSLSAEERYAMGKRAQQQILERHSTGSVMRQWHDLFERELSRKSTMGIVRS